MFSSLFDLLGFHTVWKGDSYFERGELLSRPGRGVPKKFVPTSSTSGLMHAQTLCLRGN